MATSTRSALRRAHVRAPLGAVPFILGKTKQFNQLVDPLNNDETKLKQLAARMTKIYEAAMLATEVMASLLGSCSPPSHKHVAPGQIGGRLTGRDSTYQIGPGRSNGSIRPYLVHSLRSSEVRASDIASGSYAAGSRNDSRSDQPVNDTPLEYASTGAFPAQIR